MSGRRNGNRIRGPQSALTDFLSSHNISAQQIRDDYERRVREAAQHENAGEGGSNDPAPPADPDAEAAAALAAAEAADAAAEKTRKRKRKEEAAIEKIKKAKDAKGGKKKKKSAGSDDEDDGDFDISGAMYVKAAPLPGQFENCEICNKRFTVTPYSKSGPEGGLVCTPCGKELAKEGDAAGGKKAKKPPAGRKRRQVESERLNGVALGGAKTLQQLCIEKVAQYHEDVDELGELPEPVMLRLAEIFAKKRVLNPKTLKLFVRPDSDTVCVHDAAYLEVEDYQGICAVAPGLKKLVIRNACQLKDEVIEYMMEKCEQISFIQFYAANLVSDDMWRKLFKHYGKQLRAVKLSWLDASFNDGTVQELVKHCPDLIRLKLKLCRRLTEESIIALAGLTNLERLSLQTGVQPLCENVINLIKAVGPKLRTLSFEDFLDLDDAVLAQIKASCSHLEKFRLQMNDVASDAAYANLFTAWKNPPLTFVDLSGTRDVDNNNPKGPEEAIGLASAGFKALMTHSGSALRTLDIASCRHISLEAFLDVFGNGTIYPNLETINFSFCSRVDTTVIAGVFQSCPSIRKVIAFGCFDVTDVVVPRGIALIGVPKAQDAIEQIGTSIDVAEAVGRMIDVGA
ncbi:RNI-like protein [Aureobasidium subglaciale]|nr:RNI-like protein [Aureobasidium subglaciale]